MSSQVREKKYLAFHCRMGYNAFGVYQTHAKNMRCIRVGRSGSRRFEK